MDLTVIFSSGSEHFFIKAHDEKRRQERTDKEQKEAEEARLNEQRMKDMHEATVKTLHEDRGELRTEGQGGAWVDGNAIVADYYKNYDPAAQRIQHMDSTERAEYQESLKGRQERQPSLEKPQSESKGQTQDKGQNLSPAMQKLQEFEKSVKDKVQDRMEQGKTKTKDFGKDR